MLNVLRYIPLSKHVLSRNCVQKRQFCLSSGYIDKYKIYPENTYGMISKDLKMNKLKKYYSTNSHQDTSKSTLNTNSNNRPLRDLEQSEKITEKKGLLNSQRQHRTMFKKYGWTFVIVYLCIYIIVLLAVFIEIRSKAFISAQDILQFIDKYEYLRSLRDKMKFFEDQKKEWLLDLGVAWIFTKLTEPLRIVVTLFVTPKATKILKIFQKNSIQSQFILASVMPKDTQNSCNNKDKPLR